MRIKTLKLFTMANLHDQLSCYSCYSHVRSATVFIETYLLCTNKIVDLKVELAKYKAYLPLC